MATAVTDVYYSIIDRLISTLARGWTDCPRRRRRDRCAEWFGDHLRLRLWSEPVARTV